ncbi:MAG: hypothetical protein M1820_003487 [Bogoriella megaspora]|nr:MAG: hypothetical protein M1820_003487 [Bogoriella megaspora]
MVLLSTIRSSNTLIRSILPAELVAVFVGATSGIGEATLKEFAKHCRQARVYFIGRSKDAGDRISAECKASNAEAKFEFIQADVSLIRNVDKICDEIKAKENAINLLVLSQGLPAFDRNGRMLRRVVFVAGAGKEGPVDTTDWQARRIPLTALRGQLTTMITLGLETIAKQAPDISFIHTYPGTVRTSLLDRMTGLRGILLRMYTYLLGSWVCVPLEESGERHLYLATSGRFPAAENSTGEDVGVPLREGDEKARGTSGATGSGIYSVGWDCESSLASVEKLLADYREQGMGDQILEHVNAEFERILGVQVQPTLVLRN